MSSVGQWLSVFFIKLIYSPAFMLVIKDGQLVTKKGKVTPHFLRDCTEIITRYQVTEGYLYGLKDHGGEKISIYCSENISPQVLQSIRNVWAFR